MKTKIIDKVKKLIALGTNEGASEGERENAIRMAHALLAKHNLEMSDVAESSAIEDRGTGAADYHAVPWTGIVANSMAKLFFCYLYKSKQSGKVSRDRFHFVGKESNVATAMLMTDYLIKSINKEQKKGGFSRSFNNGAANRIYWRVQEMIEPKQEETSDCTALALVNVYKSEEQANKDFIAAAGTALVEGKKTTQINKNSSEYMKGVDFGSKVNLNQQIDNKKSDAKQLA